MDKPTRDGVRDLLSVLSDGSILVVGDVVVKYEFLKYTGNHFWIKKDFDSHASRCNIGEATDFLMEEIEEIWPSCLYGAGAGACWGF